MGQRNSCRTTVRMLLSERHDPNFLPEELPGNFAFPNSPSPLLSSVFSFIPSKQPNSHYFFLIFPIPDLSGTVPPYPPQTSYCCVYHSSICLHSLQRQLCFVWRGKRKQECPPPNTHTDIHMHTQTPATQMDHTTF